MKPIITLLCCAIALEIYAQQWTTAELSEARWYPSMVANGHVLVIGGGCLDQEETFSDRVAASQLFAQNNPPLTQPQPVTETFFGTSFTNP